MSIRIVPGREHSRVKCDVSSIGHAFCLDKYGFAESETQERVANVDEALGENLAVPTRSEIGHLSTDGLRIGGGPACSVGAKRNAGSVPPCRLGTRRQLAPLNITVVLSACLLCPPCLTLVLSNPSNMSLAITAQSALLKTFLCIHTNSRLTHPSERTINRYCGWWMGKLQGRHKYQ